MTFSDVDLKVVLADVSVIRSDFSLSSLDRLDIHGDDHYVPIEFAGALVGVFFIVSGVI